MHAFALAFRRASPAVISPLDTCTYMTAALVVVSRPWLGSLNQDKNSKTGSGFNSTWRGYFRNWVLVCKEKRGKFLHLKSEKFHPYLLKHTSMRHQQSCWFTVFQQARRLIAHHNLLLFFVCRGFNSTTHFFFFKKQKRLSFDWLMLLYFPYNQF